MSKLAQEKKEVIICNHDNSRLGQSSQGQGWIGTDSWFGIQAPWSTIAVVDDPESPWKKVQPK